MIPGRIEGWHVHPKAPATVIGYRINSEGRPQPYTTVVAEVPGYNMERERIARIIAASEEAVDLILMCQRVLEGIKGNTELVTRCKAYLKLTR